MFLSSHHFATTACGMTAFGFASAASNFAKLSGSSASRTASTRQTLRLPG